MPNRTTVGTSAKPAARLPKPGPEEEQQQPTPSRGKSRADMFDEAPTEKGFDFPVGTHLAHLIECSLLIDGEKESVEFKIEVDEGEEHAGREGRTWFNFFDDKGEPMRGIGFFNAALENLGKDVQESKAAYREGREAFEDFLRNLGEERLPIVIECKEGKGGYKNIYIKGLQQE